VIWTFLPSNVAGRTKKTVTATVLFVSYCVGNAIGAQMFVASDAPKYVHGITACAVLYIVEFCGFGAWRSYCKTLQPANLMVWIIADRVIQMFGRTEGALVPFESKACPRKGVRGRES
jgi:hypothetical protein